MMMNRSRTAALVSFLTVVAATLAWPAMVLAQQFEKVEGSPKQEVPAVPFVAIAYGFIWIAILVYVVSVARSVARVRGEMDDLRRKLDRPKS